ncbi:MAG: ubiquinol-cytochrome c reductase iron-sulfur subunit [Pseudomonadota bacterium]|uniref:Ubiquinol-cytochrome c reductase iron-sulfur subunit n=1 Tax=Candidatus Desulfatibia profunda TaxID=2841695 RepID=A0A8J6NQ81_9BACT|nr:ubiquinol-cytochrome c reductase iron-sulfur subunit [Candidatus Desulfatibia profunda]MBL7179631.1 ubiquinol-cytochrome c reductase iron-sulfur subunit [Desulfobacterales bacterium]
MEKAPGSRRKFIRILVLAVISLLLLGKYLIPRVKRKKPLLRVRKKDIPGGGALVYRQKKIALIRDGRNVYALGMACTHLGCTLNATPQGFVCACHGSSFNSRGEVLRGPADRPLPRLAIEEDGEYIVIS